MAASLIGGAVLGAAFGELLKAVLEIEHKARSFEKTLAYIRTTLTAIQPVIREIEQHNHELGRPKEELESLIRDMEEGRKLVYKCSKICRCNFPARIHCQEQLAALVDSLLRFFIIDMQAQTARDSKETLIMVRRIHSAINKMSSIRTEEITIAGTSCSNISPPEIANLSSQTQIYEESTNQSSLPKQSNEDAPKLNDSYNKKISEVYMEGAYDKKAPPNYEKFTGEMRQSSLIKKSDKCSIQITQNMEETKSDVDKSQDAEDDSADQETQSCQYSYEDEKRFQDYGSLKSWHLINHNELGGAIVRAAFGELLKAVLETKGKAVMFKSTLSYLQTTLTAIDPLIKEDEHDNINYLFERPREELRLLIRQLEEVTNLVYKCSRIHKLNYLARIRCQEQLLAMVEFLVKFFIV